MDFVLALPSTQNVFDSILVADQFFWMVHFILFKKSSNASSVANLFFEEEVLLHGLPNAMVFYCDATFVSYFWKTLWTKLGTQLKISSSFHPQSDD